MGSGSSAFYAFKAVSGSENCPCGGDSFRFANFVLLQPHSDALLCQNAQNCSLESLFLLHHVYERAA